MIEQAIYALLTANAAATAGIVNGRIFWNNRPKNELNASVVVAMISANPGATFQGRGGYVTGRFQLTCLAPTYPQAKQLAAAIRDDLDGYKGTVANTTIGYLMSDDGRDVPIIPPQGGGNPLNYGVNVDVLYMYLEPLS